MTEKNKLARHSVDRRSLLKFSAAYTTTSLLAGTAAIADEAGHANIRPGGNTVKMNLDVRQVRGRPTYNGKTPGPTISVNPGDILDVNLTNNLPARHDDCADHNSFHGLNTTNLHTHGLHVSPDTDSTGTIDADNIFRKIVPKDQKVTCWDESFRRYENKYRFELPADHPSGTFWYHAHKHGSTAMQVGAGLAGPLIVRDRKGAMPSYIERAEEKIIMIMNQGAVLVDPAGGGMVNPTITMRPGEVQRWRVINARSNVESYVHLGIDAPEVELHQIAYDGFTLPKRVRVDPKNTADPWVNPAALGPGNRSDFMVRISKDAKTKTVSFSIWKSLLRFLNLQGLTASSLPIEIKIKIEGSPVDHPWSRDEKLPGPGLAPFDDALLPKRTITFGPGFVIDGDAYSGKIKQRMKLGTSEEWTVRNNSGGIHAYHIHVNPFFITHINGVKLAADSPLRRWQDTIPLPKRNRGRAGSVTFRTRFTRFTGKFVIHCHILRHEDLGMMQAVEIV